jgi:predicted nuclease of restriction endonuclease-like RecB superfamily
VLGHPALEPHEREARIAAASAQLGIEPADVESLLWADLARERPVVLPSPPDPRVLAAFANVDRIQREVRRAREIELRVWDNAHGLVRLAARCGLMTRIAREPDGALVLRIAGPLALFHATTVYGRALGALVPLLAEHARFELDIHCDLASGPHTRRVTPPVLLPPYQTRLKPSPADRLAGALEQRDHHVDREPALLAADEHVLFPDLAIDFAGVRWFIEVIGFSTPEYLADKRALYRAADANVILCVDSKRSIVDEHPLVLPYVRHIDADLLVQIMEGEPP